MLHTMTRLHALAFILWDSVRQCRLEGLRAAMPARAPLSRVSFKRQYILKNLSSTTIVPLEYVIFDLKRQELDFGTSYSLITATLLQHLMLPSVVHSGVGAEFSFSLDANSKEMTRG
ncbi:hypothetical protein NDU88_004360 [Pleurodeles waltl]|uniref:Uncharacterized protein n=1 Tax=Pleurodeles waltl TaxID=8319 RepID=A0AAV7QBR1_PLEWA|nr:hypothetical protein NDU88_004360 [Pleurodeles waltl]